LAAEFLLIRRFRTVRTLPDGNPVIVPNSRLAPAVVENRCCA